MDGRTREAKTLARLRAELAAHVGGQPSGVQRDLIERTAQLGLRLAELDRQFADAGGRSESDIRAYAITLGCYTRLLRQLATFETADKGGGLASYIASRADA